MFTLTLATDSVFLFLILDLVILVLQFLLVVLPSFGKVLFAEHISPWDRLIGCMMILAGLVATLLALVVGFGTWDFCC